MEVEHQNITIGAQITSERHRGVSRIAIGRFAVGKVKNDRRIAIGVADQPLGNEFLGLPYSLTHRSPVVGYWINPNRELDLFIDQAACTVRGFADFSFNPSGSYPNFAYGNDLATAQRPGKRWGYFPTVSDDA